MRLTTEEFLYLRSLEKQFVLEDNIALGPPPLRWEREIVAPTTKDMFYLNFSRGRIDIRKYVYNKTYRKAVVLARICATGRHTNPDGTAFNGPHFHIYDESHGDKVAYPLTELGLANADDIQETLIQFLRYFNVTVVPPIQNSLSI